MSDAAFYSIIDYEVDGDRTQSELITAFAALQERWVNHSPGYVSARIFGSLDGRRVYNLIEWESQRAYDDFERTSDTAGRLAAIDATLDGLSGSAEPRMSGIPHFREWRRVLHEHDNADMSATDPDPSEFIDVINSMWACWVAGDTDQLGTLLVDDYVEVNMGGKRSRGAARAIDALTAFVANNRIESYGIEDFLVVSASTDVAMCTYRWVDTVRIGSDRHSLSGVATDVVVRNGDSWQIASHHESRTEASPR